MAERRSDTKIKEQLQALTTYGSCTTEHGVEAPCISNSD